MKAYQNITPIHNRQLSIHEKSMYKKVIEYYQQPWRFFHNIHHIEYILERLDEKYQANEISFGERQTLVEAAFYHDVIYQPWSDTNEEDSIEFYKQQEIYDELVIDIIRSTKLPQKEITRLNLKSDHVSRLCSIFNQIDREVLTDFEPADLLEYECLIQKEFQFIDFTTYQEKRLEFIEDFYSNIRHPQDLQQLHNHQLLKSYISNYKPNIGIFPGSFNPFHNGHLSILKQAEQFFDKVIIAVGTNPNKNNNKQQIIDNLNQTLKFRQVESYNNLISEYCKDKKESESANVTLIRGLRNCDDLNNEITQLKYLNSIDSNWRKEINVMFLIPDFEYQHISSSGIRQLNNFTNSTKKLKP